MLTGTWTFKPSNANARVKSAADTDYASYGWWLKKTENDATYTASAFVDKKGTAAVASGINDLNGKVTVGAVETRLAAAKTAYAATVPASLRAAAVGRSDTLKSLTWRRPEASVTDGSCGHPHL